MAASAAIDTTLSPPEIGRPSEEQTPTTPRPNVVSGQPMSDAANEGSTASTPTRHSFGGVPGQRPLPDELSTSAPTQGTLSEAQESLKRSGSRRSTISEQPGAKDDIEMGEGEEDDGAEDDVSDNDSVTSESQRPSKKKKGQRFFCTEFPPCQLSFTRSEHLARHIR